MYGYAHIPWLCQLRGPLRNDTEAVPSTPSTQVLVPERLLQYEGPGSVGKMAGSQTGPKNTQNDPEHLTAPGNKEVMWPMCAHACAHIDTH